jgi:large subunit ribosomal protein L13
MRTIMLTKEQARKSQKWYLFNAKGQTLGRFAAEIAKVLRGKHRPDYTPSVDTGDGVVVINAEQIRVTGMKAVRKLYRSYTGYMGGLREVPYQIMMAKKPTEVLRRAILGMMPKTRLGRQQAKKLRIHAGETHASHAQQPNVVTL